MIVNMSHREWDALRAAAALADLQWEGQEAGGDAYARIARDGRKALDRAVAKCRQLAPVSAGGTGPTP